MSITQKIAEKLSKELKYDSEKSEVIAYGIFAVIQVSTSIALVIIFGLIFGIVFQSLTFSFAASILRQFSGGAHASKPSICLVVGTVATIGLAYLAHMLAPVVTSGAFIAIAFISFAYSYYFIYKKAPVDSEAKPIRTQSRKIKMKKISLCVLTAYLLFIIIFTVLFLNSQNKVYLEYSLCFCFAIVWQAFNLTVIGHKVLGKIDSLIKKLFTLGKGGTINEKN
jgi:accessory gene regulator B